MGMRNRRREGGRLSSHIIPPGHAKGWKFPFFLFIKKKRLQGFISRPLFKLRTLSCTTARRPRVTFNGPEYGCKQEYVRSRGADVVSRMQDSGFLWTASPWKQGKIPNPVCSGDPMIAVLCSPPPPLPPRCLQTCEISNMLKRRLQHINRPPRVTLDW